MGAAAHDARRNAHGGRVVRNIRDDDGVGADAGMGPDGDRTDDLGARADEHMSPRRGLRRRSAPIVTWCSMWMPEPPRTWPLMTTPVEWMRTKPGPNSAPRPMMQPCVIALSLLKSHSSGGRRSGAGPLHRAIEQHRRGAVGHEHFQQETERRVVLVAPGRLGTEVRQDQAEHATSSAAAEYSSGVRGDALERSDASCRACSRRLNGVVSKRLPSGRLDAALDRAGQPARGSRSISSGAHTNAAGCDRSTCQTSPGGAMARIGLRLAMYSKSLAGMTRSAPGMSLTRRHRASAERISAIASGCVTYSSVRSRHTRPARASRAACSAACRPANTSSRRRARSGRSAARALDRCDERFRRHQVVKGAGVDEPPRRVWSHERRRCGMRSRRDRSH